MFVNGMLYNRYTLLVLYITIHFKKTLMWNVPRNKITKSAVGAKKVEAIMIERTDIELIDRNYFEIIERSGYTLALRSLTTGHYWFLLERLANGHRTFMISHKHHIADPYHLQTYRPSISVCCEYIRDHDAYHQEQERIKEERRARRRAVLGKKQVLPR